MKIPKPKLKERIFACPYCRYKTFLTLKGLNIHITKMHPEKPNVSLYVVEGNHIRFTYNVIN